MGALAGQDVLRVQGGLMVLRMSTVFGSMTNSVINMNNPHDWLMKNLQS